MRKHLDKFRQDKDAKFRLILIESRIHRVARYYKITVGRVAIKVALLVRALAFRIVAATIAKLYPRAAASPLR